MIETLDAMHSDFLAQKDEDKYKWIARLRKFFLKKPEYKAEYHHILFISVIEFHIEQLHQERDLLQQFLTRYEDRLLDGYDYQPQRYFEKSTEVSETIAIRIREIDSYIEEYTADLNKRKHNH